MRASSISHFTIIAIVGILCWFTPLSADRSPPCYRQIQTSFFREDLLATGLNLYQISQSFWFLIYTDLQIVSPQIPYTLQKLAQGMNPNPLDPVFDPYRAMDLLQRALFLAFQSVMMKYRYVTNNNINQNAINGVFNYMWQQQANIIQNCIFGQMRR